MSNTVIRTIIVAAVVAVVVVGAKAAAPPGTMDAMRALVASTGPGYPAMKRITCNTSAQDIKPDGGGTMISYECAAKGNVVIGAGAAELTSSTGVEYVSGDRFGGNFREPEQCITASSTTVIQCRFLMTGAQ